MICSKVDLKVVTSKNTLTFQFDSWHLEGLTVNPMIFGLVRGDKMGVIGRGNGRHTRGLMNVSVEWIHPEMSGYEMADDSRRQHLELRMQSRTVALCMNNRVKLELGVSVWIAPRFSMYRLGPC